MVILTHKTFVLIQNKIQIHPTYITVSQLKNVHNTRHPFIIRLLQKLIQLCLNSPQLLSHLFSQLPTRRQHQLLPNIHQLVQVKRNITPGSVLNLAAISYRGQRELSVTFALEIVVIVFSYLLPHYQVQSV